jgi:hypothetical protein
LSRASIKGVLLAVAVLVAVVVPVGLGLHQPRRCSWSRCCLNRRQCPPLPSRVRQTARGPPRIRSAGVVSNYGNRKAISQLLAGHGDVAHSAKSRSLLLERVSQYPGNPQWPSSRR